MKNILNLGVVLTAKEQKKISGGQPVGCLKMYYVPAGWQVCTQPSICENGGYYETPNGNMQDCDCLVCMQEN